MPPDPPDALAMINTLTRQPEPVIYVRVLDGDWEAVRLSEAETADLQLARRRAWANYYGTPRGGKHRSERDWMRSMAVGVEYELGRRKAGIHPPRGYHRPVSLKDPQTQHPDALGADGGRS